MLETVIDEDAIAHNVRRIKALLSPGTKLMCVVKADAYGHGIGKVVPVMERAGADAFAVATLDEAKFVKTTKPVLAWIWDVAQDLVPGVDLAVPSLCHARRLVTAKMPVRVYVEVETGMHRSGVEEHAWEEVFQLLNSAPHIEVLGLMSHFACADELSNTYTDEQAEIFQRAIATARALGLECPVNHLANTAATLTRPEFHFQQVRVGLGLYGLEPCAGLDHGLVPAMTWRAKVAQVKPVSQGQGVSYGLTFRAPRDGFLANIPVGYADGLPRNFQGLLHVGIGGRLYPQVGRVCMDQILVDLGENPEGVCVGDSATIFGAGGLSATQLATAAGTIGYEVLCRPTGRTKRRYQGGNNA